MSKQTSVDFLIEEFSAILRKVNFTSMQGLLMKDAVEKAKEMERDQIMQAFEDGNEQGFICKTGEEYYNETYKKEEKC
jgi:hypothetical protein